MKLRPLLFLAALLALLRPAAAQTLEQFIADPQLWPAEVSVLGATKATLIRNGQPAGMMLIGAGKKLTVSAITAEGVTGKLGGTTVRVAVDKTNLLTGGAAPAAAAAPEPAPEPEPAAAAASGESTPMSRLFDGKLVRYNGGRVQSFDTGGLGDVKYYALYYSAAWCGPCREFTPQLVSAYRDLKAAHPEFELVFLSNDNSAGEMAGYMKEDRMPWPAAKFDAREEAMMRYCGPGIPCLVLVNSKGKVISDSFVGGDYVGPRKVLDDIRRTLARGR